MLSFKETAARLSESPFHRLLGLELVALSPLLKIRFTSAAVLEGRPASGLVHGGVLAALIDTSGSYAIIAREGATVATADLLIDYHRPAPLGILYATGEVMRVGRSLCTTRSIITDTEDKLVASGRCSFVRISRD
jgi:uncharacterized protein (TIGR00369 family)